MRRSRFDHVLQFRINLLGVSPPVWRTILVPHTYSFWDLHVAIQDATGWEGNHLHVFVLRDPLSREMLEIGVPDFYNPDDPILPGWNVKVAQFITLLNPKVVYTYDFGDVWRHSVTLQKVLPREKDVDYPRLVSGKRHCPPEDCGGPPGYKHFPEAISNPNHKNHKEMMEWIGKPFDPEQFDEKAVSFTNPEERFRTAFKELPEFGDPDFYIDDEMIDPDDPSFLSFNQPPWLFFDTDDSEDVDENGQG